MTNTTNVIAFPTRYQAASPKTPMPTLDLESEMEKLAVLMADRARRKVREWMAAEGKPDEAMLLVRRLACLMRCPEGISEDARSLLRDAVAAGEVSHG